MAGSEVLAAIMGALEGGVGSWQAIQRLNQQDRDRQAQLDRQKRLDDRADAEHALRMEEAEERRRDRALRDTDAMLTSIGRGGRLSPEQAGRARELDLGHRVEAAPDFSHSYFTQAGPMPLMVPEVMSRVAPTAAERRGDQVAAEKRRGEEEARAALLRAIENLPAHLKPSAEFGAASGKMPTLGSADFVSPQERTDQEIARETGKAKALLPFKIREREALKEVDDRPSRFQLPVRDDPTLPRGVRAYLGDLVGKYTNDPAAARAELQRATPDLYRDHPNLDMTKVMHQMNAMLPLPQLTDEEKAAAAAERAAARGTVPGSGVPPAAAPRPQSQPAPAAAGPAAKTAAAKYQVGQRVRTKSGQMVTITQINPDGSYEVK